MFKRLDVTRLHHLSSRLFSTVLVVLFKNFLKKKRKLSCSVALPIARADRCDGQRYRIDPAFGPLVVFLFRNIRMQRTKINEELQSKQRQSHNSSDSQAFAFSNRDATFCDESDRRCRQLSPHEFNLAGPDWASQVRRLVDERVKRDLGLPGSLRVFPRLYKCLLQEELLYDSSDHRERERNVCDPGDCTALCAFWR